MQNIRTMARGVARVAVAAMAVMSLSAPAWAKDSVQVEVANATGSPVIKNNGQAVGTIQVFYAVNATEFTTGLFAEFDLNWLTVLGSRPTNYGSGITFELIQDQQGGHVDLIPAPDAFQLTNAGQTGSSRIEVHIAVDKDGNPPPSADGADLVGNLKLDAGSQVGTVTNVQVHIRLVHPTACIKAYDFVTDQDFDLGVLSTANLNSPTSGRNAGKINSSQPGQFSDNVLVANVCGTAESFDMQVTLDPSMSTNPAGNPGNAVFAYTASGEFDPTTFGALLSGSGTAYQQQLCLQNVTVPAGATLLVTVHSKVKDGLMVSQLPDPRVFNFSATLYDQVNNGCSGPLETLALPNPATFALPFTVNNQ